jgi:hypothetical protein
MAAMLNMIVCCLLGNFIVAEAIMVPKKDDVMERALPALLQRDVARIHDVSQHVEDLSTGSDQRACQGNAYRSRVMAELKKLEGIGEFLDSNAFWGIKYRELFYYVTTVGLSIAQFTVDGSIANKGETASTSPSSILEDADKTCREHFVTMINSAQTSTLTGADFASAMTSQFKKSMKCIMDDMDKCVPIIRTLEWASAAIDNIQSLVDTIYSIEEIRGAQREVDTVADELYELAEKELRDSASEALQIRNADLTGKHVENTEAMLANLDVKFTEMNNRLKEKGLISFDPKL